MKTLLTQTLRRTSNAEVFDALTKTFPSFYNDKAVCWDAKLLSSGGNYNDLKMIPCKMFYKYSVEIAKVMVKYGCPDNEAEHFGKTFLSRPLTDDEFDIITKASHEDRVWAQLGAFIKLNGGFQRGRALKDIDGG